MNRGRRPLLAVRNKSRLPAGWAYPVGTEILSDVLAGLPGLAERPLWFSHGDDLWLRDRRARQLDDHPIVVLEVEYSRWVADTQEPVWTIGVRSVPAVYRKWVRVGMLSEGLPRMKAWLAGSFSSTELGARPRGRILFQEGMRRLIWASRNSTFEQERSEVLSCGPEAS